MLEAAQTIIGEYERAREQQAQAAMDKIGQAIHDAFCPCGAGEASHTADDGDQDQDDGAGADQDPDVADQHVAGDQEAAPATT